MATLANKIKLENYCAYQERCIADVRQKAAKLNMDTAATEACLHWLITENFLNEERYVRAYIKGHFYQKKWGLQKIKQALSRKKIDKELIAMVAAEIDDSAIADNLLTLATRKWKTIKGKDFLDRKQKLIRFLLAKGYSYDNVKNTIATVCKN